jgi:alpha-N-arabinofuranosidase
MILTQGSEMVLTPSYYVFRMYRAHQDATLLPAELTSPDYKFNDTTISAMTAAASRDDKSVVHISLTNADPHHTVTVECQLAGAKASKPDEWKVSGEVLTADQMSAYNDFGKDAAVKPAAFSSAKVTDGALSIELPAKSVVMITIAGVASP